MDIVFAAMKNSDEWNWMFKRAEPILTVKSKGIVVRDMSTDLNDIVAMAVFDNWTETSVQMHMAIDKVMVLRHGFLEEIAKYVYTQAKRDIILACVPSDNTKALRLNKKIGMTAVHTIKEGFKKGVDYVLLELRKEDCRWLHEEYS